MIELHRNDKIKIIVVLGIIVGLVFFTFITIGIVVFGGIIELASTIIFGLSTFPKKVENPSFVVSVYPLFTNLPLSFMTT